MMCAMEAYSCAFPDPLCDNTVENSCLVFFLSERVRHIGGIRDTGPFFLCAYAKYT